MTDSPPSFSLIDQHRRTHDFPAARPALLCFVEEACPTCNLTIPLVEEVWRAFGAAVDIVAIGQDAPGNAALVERYKLTVPMLDDSALKVSYSYKIEIVPTIVLADAKGAEVRRFEGFDKSDWQNLCSQLARMAGGGAPDIDWSAYPASRPGCGSKSVEPGVGHLRRVGVPADIGLGHAVHLRIHDRERAADAAPAALRPHHQVFQPRRRSSLRGAHGVEQARHSEHPLRAARHVDPAYRGIAQNAFKRDALLCRLRCELDLLREQQAEQLDELRHIVGDATFVTDAHAQKDSARRGHVRAGRQLGRRWG